MITFRKMTPLEFRDFRKLSIAKFADEMVRFEDADKEDALVEAEDNFIEMLPKDVDTEDHYLMAITNPVNDSSLYGWIWFATQINLDDEKEVCLNDLIIKDSERGKGYKAEAIYEMECMAKEFLDCKISSICVNESDESEIEFYQKHGYTKVNTLGLIEMQKSLDILPDDIDPSYSFLVGESNNPEESDYLFMNAKKGDPVQIIYDKTNDKYFLRFPYIDYYGQKLNVKDYNRAKNRLLFVTDNTVGNAGIKQIRYLQVSAFECRSQKTTFFEIVKEQEESDMTIGKTYLKRISSVSEGKEKRLLEESKNWTITERLVEVFDDSGNVMKNLDLDRHTLQYTIIHDSGDISFNIVGIIVKNDFFYGCVFKIGRAEEIALSKTDNLGLFYVDGKKDGITELKYYDALEFKNEDRFRVLLVHEVFTLEKTE